VLPRGLVPLEELFDFDGVAKKPKIEPVGNDLEDCNIGTIENPKIGKLSKYLPPKVKKNTLIFLKNSLICFPGAMKT